MQTKNKAKEKLTTSSPQIGIYLNNNPNCSAELENIANGEKWDQTNTPSITVNGTNFGTTRKDTITIIFRGHLIEKKEIDIIKGKFVNTIELASPLQNPKEIEIKVGDYFHKKIPVELKRIYGTVTYFDGTPVSYPIVGDWMFTVGDEKGNFEYFLCGKKDQIPIFEKNYSKTTLECWLYDVDIKKDTKLNVKIDKLEVYELGAWLSYKGNSFPDIYIHFVPMSVIGDTFPHIEESNVKVFIGMKKASILMFNEYPNFLSKSNGKKLTRPGYILCVREKDYNGKIIKVEITHTVKIGNKKIVEKGEGYFLGFVKHLY
ncbi:MAG: hypothetical protein WC614_06910 [bacterium]